MLDIGCIEAKFARKYAFESSRRDLHNALLCTALKSHFQKKIARILLQFAKYFSEILNFANFRKINKCFENFRKFLTTF